MLTRNPIVLKCPTFTPKPKSPAELAELDLSAAAKAERRQRRKML